MLNIGDKLLNLKQASEYTPYSDEYLGLLIRKGRLVGFKRRGRWYTTKEAVNGYMQKVAEESYQHHESLAARVSEVGNKKFRHLMPARLIIVAVVMLIIVAGSYVYVGSRKSDTCAYFEMKKDVNGKEIITVGGKEYVRNILASTKSSFAKLEF